MPWAPKPSGRGSRERWRGAALPGTHAVGPDVIRRGRDLSHLLFCPHYRSADRMSCEVHLETKDGWTGAHFPSAESTFENCLQNGPADVPDAAPLSDWTRINEKATADMPFTSFNIAGPRRASVGGLWGHGRPTRVPSLPARQLLQLRRRDVPSRAPPIPSPPPPPRPFPLPCPAERGARVLARKPKVAHVAVAVSRGADAAETGGGGGKGSRPPGVLSHILCRRLNSGFQLYQERENICFQTKTFVSVPGKTGEFYFTVDTLLKTRILPRFSVATNRGSEWC